DHVYRYGNARVIAVAELIEQFFRLLPRRFAGDLLTEFISFAEFLAHDLRDVVRMKISLGEDQRFRHFPTTREDFGKQLVAKCADDESDLTVVNHVAVELVRS